MKVAPGKAHLLLDLGFGDAGKGLLTDLLVRRTGAPWVVRYNGGAQAGHNVVAPDGRHHTFSQFGAGTFFPGVRTLLAAPVLVHPTALLCEGEALRRAGVPDALARLHLSERARLITPYHQAVGRLRELARGSGRHGSCGVGVGEAVRDDLAHPDETLVAGDLRDLLLLRRKLARLRDRKREEASALASSAPPSPAVEQERALFDDDGAPGEWARLSAGLAGQITVQDEEALPRLTARCPAVVFEGAQGLLLDETAGFHPHTTWSPCTLRPAAQLASRLFPHLEMERVGLLRAHAVRHGAGPLPTETGALQGLIREHNTEGPWQGPLRYGWFDSVLARYALEVAGPLDTLVLTHLDALPRLPGWLLCAAYARDTEAETAGLVREEATAGHIRSLAVHRSPPLERQERLGHFLSRARPVYEECASDERTYLDAVERLVGRPVELVSRGPRAGDVALRPTGSRGPHT